MDNIFSKFINNKINIQRLEKFAVIIGENPSKTARSPLLWNAAFRANKLNYSMVPLDVSKKNLVNVLNALKKNKDFIGGSVTVPYKIDIAKWLKDNLTIEAKNIGAVNCLYKNKDEVLKGTNTDGEASLISFKKKFGEINNKNIY